MDNSTIDLIGIAAFALETIVLIAVVARRVTRAAIHTGVSTST